MDHPAKAGRLVVLSACAVAFAGGCLRLRARRRQRALAHAVAGERRFPLLEGTPESDGHRGHRRVYAGLALCLAAATILTDSLFAAPTASGVAYDTVGQVVTRQLDTDVPVQIRSQTADCLGSGD
ncbi:hypothetical protein ACIGO6_33520 [Streptomyces sp. NPDC053750]|uniref:hypothetical protein n=1 Tax=Streptomyces sp. NPDC053750 TaxID=3365714 RepID=UPI0037CEDC36